jgi:hypothetical protein
MIQDFYDENGKNGKNGKIKVGHRVGHRVVTPRVVPGIHGRPMIFIYHLLLLLFIIYQI